MSVLATLPAPRTNQTPTRLLDATNDLVAADIIVAAGDENGGTADDQFTLASHGLATGDYVYLLYKSLMGSVTGRVGSRFRVKIVSANIFQLTDASGAVVVNTADGTAVFLRATHRTSPAAVNAILGNSLIVAAGDFTGGTTEDEFVAAQTGLHGLEETDTLRLLYKSASGVVTGIAADTVVYAKSVRPDGFELAATSGGADIENSADGTAIFVKTS